MAGAAPTNAAGSKQTKGSNYQAKALQKEEYCYKARPQTGKTKAPTPNSQANTGDGGGKSAYMGVPQAKTAKAPTPASKAPAQDHGDGGGRSCFMALPK